MSRGQFAAYATHDAWTRPGKRVRSSEQSNTNGVDAQHSQVGKQVGEQSAHGGTRPRHQGAMPEARTSEDTTASTGAMGLDLSQGNLEGVSGGMRISQWR
jgi:hypothetical protein